MGKQFSIYLDENEAKRLTEIAIRECRRPADHARYIIRSALLQRQPIENSKPADRNHLAERTVNGFESHA